RCGFVFPLRLPETGSRPASRSQQSFEEKLGAHKTVPCYDLRGLSGRWRPETDLAYICRALIRQTESNGVAPRPLFLSTYLAAASCRLTQNANHSGSG